MAPQLCVLAYKKSVSSVCSQEMTAYLTPLPDAIWLPVSCFLKRSNIMRLLGAKSGM